MDTRTDRRTILRALGVTGAATLAWHSPSVAIQVNDSGSGVGERIVVLGAGLAGLCVAYNLMHRGYDVTILEAQDRPGGRVLTVRDGFQHGGYAEMGAVRVIDTHEHTLKYIDEFGLELIPYDEGARAFYLQDTRFLAPAAGDPWSLPGLSADERPNPTAQFPQYVESGFEKLGDLADPEWPGTESSALDLDTTTLDGYMQSQGASQSWRDWFYAQNGRIGRVNAAAGFAVESLQAGNMISGIKGGNDRLPYAFANALGGRVKYGSEVIRIAQDADSVTVGYMDQQGQQELRADRCVCALPFAPLRRVRLDAGFSPEKLAAIAGLLYMPAARCYFQTATRFWEDDPLGPLGGLDMIGTDTMAGRVWNTSSQQDDSTAGMLHAYMFDSEALAFTSHGHRRVDAMRRLFQTLLPGFKEREIGVAHKAWHEDPWAGGGWGWAQPGDLAQMLPVMRQPEGRVHFAGEHTSLWIAWMNGALESAERVVEEIVRAPATPTASPT